MIKFKEHLSVKTENNDFGDVKLYLSDLAGFDIRNPKLKLFSLAQLKPGEEVGFHIHEGECEYYYIISGTGVYNDNGKIINLAPGMVTFNPSGSCHGIRNTGREMIEFVAIILKD